MVERVWLMGAYATVLIVIVLGIRCLLKQYSKVYCYLLWILVLIRLVCPVFVTYNFSIPNDRKDTVSETHVREEITKGDSTEVETQYSLQDSFEDKVKIVDWSRVINGMKVVWLLGVTLAVSIVSLKYLNIKKELQTAIREDDAVWLSDQIESPFVFGLCHPKIYLPFGIEEKERDYIIKHETTHIRHKDSWIRAMGTLAVCLHWWNPIVWYGVSKINQDMEMFCDETVLKNASNEERKDYARILLLHSIKHSRIQLVMAFGESNTEKRVKHLSKRKKRGTGITAMIVTSMVVMAVFFVTLPKQRAQASNPSGDDLEKQIKFFGGDQRFQTMLNDPADQARTFLKEFYAAVVKDEKEQVASLMPYPRKLHAENEIIEIQNANDFVKHYDLIITDQFKVKLKGWLEEEINYTYLGMYLNDGEIWILLGENGWFIASIDNAEGKTIRYE
ncbi:MAG: M56 family metallopeptidase [bacterium]|nr:M56 family metallopeptidase [bacterium]